MDDPLSISREMSGRTASASTSRTKKPTRHKPAGRQQEPARTKQPRASLRASAAAQDWYDRGQAMGFDFPYDVNYFALALQRKVERDPKMSRLLDDGDKVDRWLAKMNANWWANADEDGSGGGYIDGTITGRNAKEVFLEQDWDDVRDFAHSNLRKDYLLKHGTFRKPAVNPNTTQQHRERLQEIHDEAQVKRYLATNPEEGGREELDPEGRSRLRSFANRRRRKK